MRRFRRDDVSDAVAEALLAPGVPADDAASPLHTVVSELRAAGQSPPSEAVAERHLAAIVSEVRRPSEAAAGAAPRRTGRARVGAVPRLVPPRLAGGITAFTVFAALVVGGALPGPVQAAAADVLGVVGISVPDGRSVDRTDAKPIPEPARRLVTPGDSSPEGTTERPQRARPLGVRGDDHQDQDRSGAPAGQERDDDRERADDGVRGSRDGEGDEPAGDAGDERRPDADREPDGDGSSPEPDAPDDADDSGGDGPSAGPIDTGGLDTIDEPYDSGSGSEDRSGPSDDPLSELDPSDD